MRMTIGAELGEIGRVQAAFAAFAEAQALPVAVRRGVSVALDELLNNAIRYGFAGGTGELAIAIERDAERLSATISDNGKPFDPFAMSAPDTALPLEERPVGGLGIHLVRQLMDEASYQRREGRNVVVLTKRLAERA